MAFELSAINPTSVPINLLIPRAGTKFGERELMDPWEAVKWVAIFRLILPEALFRLCGGRIENLGELGAMAVRAGLNGVMMGNFLTALGATPEEDRAMFERARPEHRPPARQRRQPAARQPLRAGSRARRRTSSSTTSTDDAAMRVHLWDPSTQLRYRSKRARLGARAIERDRRSPRGACATAGSTGARAWSTARRARA